MFDPDANMPRINRGMVYLGACLIAGIRLARERQVSQAFALGRGEARAAHVLVVLLVVGDAGHHAAADRRHQHQPTNALAFWNIRSQGLTGSSRHSSGSHGHCQSAVALRSGWGIMPKTLPL